MKTDKKIVRYYKDKGVELAGDRALLYPMDHPDSLRVSNTTLILTSKVINFDRDTGILETENSLYTPYPSPQETA